MNATSRSSQEYVLAQCDVHLSRCFVEKRDRKVVPMVNEPFSQCELETAFSLEKRYKNCFDLLTRCYRDAEQENFYYKNDSFDGYGLFYGKNSALVFSKKRDTLLPNLTALIEPIKDSDFHKFRHISILASTDICKNNRIMVGPVRFANHSCQPDSEYVASTYRDKKCIKLKALKTLQKDDEITVFYGDNFFGDGNWDCQCPHKEKHGDRPLVFSQKQKMLIQANLEKRFVFLFNRKKRSEPKARRLKNSELRYFSSSESLSDQNSSSSGSEDFHSTENISNEVNAGTSDNVSNEIEERSCLLLENVNRLSENDCAVEMSSDNLSDDFNNEVTTNNWETAISLITAKHGTSDSEAKDWIRLIKRAFPNAAVPFFGKIKNKHHISKRMVDDRLTSYGSGDYWKLDFMTELVQVIEANIEQIENFSMLRDSDEDIPLKPCFNWESRSLKISINLNSDGVRIIKSSPKQLWPVWIAIVNLPPILRCSYKNIILVALWFGNNNPDWNVISSDISSDLRRKLSINYKNVSSKVSVEVILLVSDLPATASMLNMHHHLASYGCTLCLVKTETTDKMRYYPYKKFAMRTPDVHRSHLKKIKDESLMAFMGVKGPSPLFDLIPNLPLTAPSDIMHQVYIRVTKVLLRVIYDKNLKVDLECLKYSVNKLRLPSEFKRTIRPLDQLEFFKANELKAWLFYVGPALFSGSINERLYERFLLFSYGIRLLMLSRKYVKEGKKHIEEFLNSTKSDYTEFVFTANVHALSHLAWQFENFGPLWTTSGMMFESANHLLSSKFTGTVNHLSVLVERYLRNKAARRERIATDPLTSFCEKLQGLKSYKRKFLNPELVPEEVRKPERVFYRNQQFRNFEVEGHPNEKDCFVSIRHNSKIICGKIRFFSKKERKIFCQWKNTQKSRLKLHLWDLRVEFMLSMLLKRPGYF